MWPFQHVAGEAVRICFDMFLVVRYIVMVRSSDGDRVLYMLVWILVFCGLVVACPQEKDLIGSIYVCMCVCMCVHMYACMYLYLV